MILDIILWPFLMVYRFFDKMLSLLNKPITPKKKKKDIEKEITFVDFTKEDNTKNNKKIRYKYIVKDSSGKEIKGFFDAYSKVDVHSFLLSQNYEVLSIEEDKVSTKIGLAALAPRKKMKAKELNFFLTQLSTYIKAGIPLADAMAILSRQAKKRNDRYLYQRIVFELNSGVSFSDALVKQGEVFPRLLINMVKTSELTGDITEVLDDMAVYYKNADETRKQIISAMTYPSIIFIFAMCILTFILIFIVPDFVDMYAESGLELPSITVAIINVSDFFRGNYIIIIIFLVVLISTVVVLYKNVVTVRYGIQWFLMHIPVVKNIIIYNEIIMFTGTFASLVNHDVFITDSMEILKKVTNNEIYKVIIKNAVTNLSSGESLSLAFKGHWAFPGTAYEMLVTGENTGRLGPMMQTVSEYYSSEQKVLVAQLKSLIEPIMIVSLAVIVGIILLAVIVPMFSMYEGIL